MSKARVFVGGLVALAIPVLLASGQAWDDGEHGLWRLQFADGSYLSAADVATNGVRGACTTTRDGAATRRVWRTDRADVTVTETPVDAGAVDLRAEVTPHGADAKMLELPANRRFRPESVQGFVYPGRGNSGIGMAFNEKFFLPSPENRPTAWHVGAYTYGKGYRHLYGASLKMQPLGLPPTNLVTTAEGAKWLGAGADEFFSRHRRAVLRPPAQGQSDIVLIDSPTGPYLSGKHFGGAGMLWRFGVAGGGHDRYAPPLEAIAIRRMLPQLAAKAPGRTRVALVALRCGPKGGAFVPTPVSDWQKELSRAIPRGCTFETLGDVAEMRRALESRDTLIIVNPYGEYFPCGREEDYIPCLDAVRDFVRAGGNWVEAGGYSFYRPLVAGGYFSIRTPYPPLFADFAHLTTADGRTVACYGVQPRGPHEPWRNPVPFVPGETGAGGDAHGGWFFHAFACWAKDGQTAKTPAVRIRTSSDLETALADYARANTLARPISDKVKDPAKVDLFRRAPLFFIGGTAQEKIAALDVVPVPSLIHYSDYLKGGFDKEYPDHLPPHPAFGTGEELRAFHDLAHAKGHLVSPYTNPTWWCDHPRGPSFIAAGEAPLALGFDGKPYHEQYAKNDGWTITFWYPAVQAANRKTVREFTVDYPVDLLFQDQCGARTWRWDFNPASPSPIAYTEGILSMNEEDSGIVPLGTEDGWDHVANLQTAICGCTWRIVPVPRPPWRDLFKDVYPAESWCIEPVATRLFHDKAFFYMHDLGSFVTNERTLAWMFAIGYQLSWRTSARNYVADKAAQAWYEWLQLLQDKVVSRIALQPVVAFAHDRAPLLALPGDPSRESDDGVVTARYGDVSVAVNLGDVPRTVAGKRLAAYGWWITAPGLEAAMLEGKTPYVEAEGRRWEYRLVASAPAPYRKVALQAGHAAKMRLGCQMWGVKEFWEKNPEKGFAEVFPKLRAMGYEGVQSMAFWKVDPDRLEALLKANGLALADMPVNFEHVEGTNIENSVAFCRRFGVDFVYIPWFKGKTADEWRAFCGRLAAAGKRLEPYGIRIGYHNHVHEFTEPLGGELPANILKADRNVNLELDIGPVAESGNDAPAWIAALSGRVPGMHAKPHGATAAGAPGDVQDWPKVVDAARKAGVKWFVVECEKRKDTYDDVAASAAYLKPLLLR